MLDIVMCVSEDFFKRVIQPFSIRYRDDAINSCRNGAKYANGTDDVRKEMELCKNAVSTLTTRPTAPRSRKAAARRCNHAREASSSPMTTNGRRPGASITRRATVPGVSLALRTGSIAASSAGVAGARGVGMGGRAGEPARGWRLRAS